MKTKIVIGISAAVVALAIIGAVLIFGNFFRKDPKLAVTEAAENTINEFTESAGFNFTAFKQNVLSGVHKADAEIEINNLSGELFAGIEPSVLAAVQMFTLKDSLRYDPVNKLREDRVTVQLAVTPLAELILYASPDEIALSAPIAFDYFITADPEHFPNAWNNSLVGQTLAPGYGYMLEGPVEEIIYNIFSYVWLPDAYEETEPAFDIELYKRILDDGAEYLYIGKETLTDGEWEKDCEAYDVTFPPSALQSLSDAVAADILKLNTLPQELTGGYAKQLTDAIRSAVSNVETLRVFVTENKIAGVRGGQMQAYFKGGDINLSEIRMFGEFDGGELSWNIDWDTAATSDENFTFEISSVTGGNEASVSAVGQCTVNDELFDIRIDNFIFTSELPGAGMEADISFALTLRPDTGTIDAPADKKLLTDLGAMDFLMMYAKLLEDPKIGALLAQIQL